MKTKYQVAEASRPPAKPELEIWETCTKAQPQPSGWLHYELRDGTIGLARPGRWREKPQRPKAGA